MIRKNRWKVVLFWQALYINKLLFITVTRLSRSLLKTVKRSSIHRLQLGFIKVFFASVGFGYLTTLNVIYLRRFLHDVVALKCCLKWAANESGFFLFWGDVGYQRNDRLLFS